MPLGRWPARPMAGGRPHGRVFQRLSASDDWVCEAKLDGLRTCWTDGRLLTSSGQEHPHTAALAVLRADLEMVDTMLDGELVGDTLWVFDLPTGQCTYCARRWALERTVKRIASPLVRIVPVGVQWHQIVAYGWEGVVFKRRLSPYPNNSKAHDWVKYRAAWAREL